MQRRLRYLLLLPICLMFHSCFQIIEEISVQPNGSGTVVLTANLSQSRSKLASVMLLDSINGHKIPSKQDIRSEMEEAVKILRGMKGISQVSHTMDFDKYIATIRFSFAQVANLNDITTIIFEKLKVKSANNSAYTYHTVSKTFNRHYSYEAKAKSEYNKLKSADKEIFQNAMYTSIYRFDDTVLKQSNGNAKISASKKAVMLQCPILDLIDGKINISNNIQLSN
ncbi:hypothetical protein [Parapedobacter tibetensis]|uniref:hypothetical protein n=1 Tax=Parapedobacter tibetensis TaxID=2972951 RepID=UPI00214DC0C3|nr:hypothetical protein [Parapedobacter tibetensis]